MQPCAVILTAVAMAVALAVAARAEDAGAPDLPRPTLLSPADDPDQEHCFLPDARRGIRLDWQRLPGGAEAPAEYLEIRRYDADADEWRPWLKQYANPPFTLTVRPRVYDEVFAWRVWAVKRGGGAATKPSDWWLFCTLPKSGD
jgi:hypothetical protein